MSRDEQKFNQVNNELEGAQPSTAFTAEVTMKRVGGPDPSLSIEELERNFGIARARYIYACQKVEHYRALEQNRARDYNEAALAYLQAKYDIKDEDLEKSWSQTYLGVFEHKK